MPKQLFSTASRLPQEALDNLRSILDSYERLRCGKPPQCVGADKEVADLRVRLKETPEEIRWSDIAQAELCVGELLDEAQLRARLGGWRRRFRETAGDSRYVQYLAGAPDLASSTVTESQLRADLSECIRAVYYFYSAYGVGARTRSDVTKALLRVALAILSIEGILALLASWHRAPGMPVIFIGNSKILELVLATSAAAVLGSVVSVQRRLQDPKVDVDPIFRYVQTTADWFGIAFVSPLFAAIFGALVYALLASKLVNVLTFKNGAPMNETDVAVLLILGFSAGFAEQLVPDALTRIATRALTGSSGGGSQSVTPIPSLPNDRPPTPVDSHPQNTVDRAQLAAPNESQALTTLPGAAKLAPITSLQPTKEATALGHDPSLTSVPDALKIQGK